MVAMAMPKLPKKMATYHLCFSCYVWQQEEMEEYEPHRDLGIHLNTTLNYHPKANMMGNFPSSSPNVDRSCRLPLKYEILVQMTGRKHQGRIYVLGIV
jgi:hypothetical protein